MSVPRRYLPILEGPPPQIVFLIANARSVRLPGNVIYEIVRRDEIRA